LYSSGSVVRGLLLGWILEDLLHEIEKVSLEPRDKTFVVSEEVISALVHFELGVSASLQPSLFRVSVILAAIDEEDWSFELSQAFLGTAVLEDLNLFVALVKVVARPQHIC